MDTTGAQAVADAVKRVADAAVAEIQKSPATDTLTFVSSAGRHFVLRGSGLGTSGTVKVGGADVRTTSWTPTHIEGLLPPEALSGDVEIVVASDGGKTAKLRVPFGPSSTAGVVAK